MSTLRQAIHGYLELRRSLGFKLELHETMLRDFGSFMEQEKAEFITTERALCWAQRPRDVQPAQWSRRLSMVRGFALHWSATDPRTEVPPLGLLPHRFRRRAPYIYSDAEIRSLLVAARQLRPARGVRPWTYATLFGLLAVTGLRISEATALDREDVDLSTGILTIRRTKFGKSRLVPVHPSTRMALLRYARRRDRLLPKPQTPSFFLSHGGTRLTRWSVRWTFVHISHHIGLRQPADRRGPRLHDFRHAFAVRTLVRWYREGLEVERQMPILSAYLGHTHVADSYWYLSAVPELLALASARLEQAVGDLP